ncbi:MAG: hypothetical protein IT372_21855 [Polyangiaceae bacterium]|nr:hypothetical protein [Polyangiaceae bacterium]
MDAGDPQPEAMETFDQAWQGVLRAIDELRNASGRMREHMSETARSESAPELAEDPAHRQMLERYLYLERLAGELGRIADDARRGTDEAAPATE